MCVGFEHLPTTSPLTTSIGAFPTPTQLSTYPPTPNSHHHSHLPTTQPTNPTPPTHHTTHQPHATTLLRSPTYLKLLLSHLFQPILPTTQPTQSTPHSTCQPTTYPQPTPPQPRSPPIHLHLKTRLPHHLSTHLKP